MDDTYTLKNITDFPNIAYHGTTSNNIESIKNKIDLKKGTKYSDFGEGYYLTYNFKQALEWARKRRDSYNSLTNSKCVDGVVLVYNVDNEILKDLNSKLFMFPNAEWAKFIYNNRSKKIKSFNHTFDFVFGSVADGNITDLIKRIDDDIITLEKAIEEMNYGLSLDLSNQISLNTYKAVKCLKLRNEVKYDDGKRKANTR